MLARPPFRLPGRRVPLGALALSVVAIAIGGGCGPSEADLRREAYEAYTAKIEPLLDQDQERWSRVKALLDARQDDPESPGYWAYLRETAQPFYEGLRGQIAKAKPSAPALLEAHADLVDYADSRLEFVFAELGSQRISEEVAGNQNLLAVFSGQDDAEGLRIDYLRAVGQGAPDAKLAELYAIVSQFRLKHFEPMREGTKDAADVQRHLSSSVLPRLEELRRRKFAPDGATQLLKECVVAWLEWHRQLETACPLLQRMYEANRRSEAAATAAEESFSSFREKLQAARLAR